VLIGILSDTHDRVDAMAAAMKLLRDAGAQFFIHCGAWANNLPATVDSPWLRGVSSYRHGTRTPAKSSITIRACGRGRHFC